MSAGLRSPHFVRVRRAGYELRFITPYLLRYTSPVASLLDNLRRLLKELTCSCPLYQVSPAVLSIN